MSETYKFLRVTESGLLKNSFGKLKKVIINSHTSGTLKLWDTASNPGTGAPAVGTLTSTGALTAALRAVTELTSSGAMVAGTHAVSVMTGDAIANGNVMVIGTRTYTFKSELSNNPSVVDEILIGATLTATLLNAKNAINAASGAGLRGVTYSRETTVNTQVVAVASDATTLTVRGRVPGTSLNTVATTGTALRTVWADTTLGGGTGASDAGVTTGAATVTIGSIVYTIVDALSETYGATAVPYQVVKGANEASMLDNLKLAVNGTGTAGTHYSTGTVAHPTVIATTNTDTVQTFRSRLYGTTAAETTAINAIATTETMANTAFADTTLGGGTGNCNPAVTAENATITIGSITYTVVTELAEGLGLTAVPYEVLWVTSEAVFLDNLKLAINGNGVPGTEYGTGTLAHPDVKATTNANDSQVVEARLTGTGGNSIATTETLGNYAWGAATLASGTGGEGRVVCNTITFSAVATTGEREIDFGELAFDRGLYAVVGGVADLTFVYE